MSKYTNLEMTSNFSKYRYPLIGKYVRTEAIDQYGCHYHKYGRIKYRNGQYYIDQHYEGEWIVKMADGEEHNLNQDAFEIISEEEYTINVVMDT